MKQERKRPFSSAAEKILPSSEMARRGVVAFDQMMQSFSPAARKVIFYIDFCRMFVGTTPETGGNSFNLSQGIEPEVQAEIENAFAATTDFMIVPFVRKRSRDSRYSFINIPAATRVMSNFAQYFPKDAIESPREWLSQNTRKWKRTIPYGLLSGFPLESVLTFDKAIKEGRESIPVGSRVNAISIGGFISFDSEAEQHYIAQSREIFLRSGIIAVIDKWEKNEGLSIV